MDYGFIAKYNELRDTIGKMIRADRGLLGDEYSWLPVHGSDITDIDECGDDHLEIGGSTWTNQTGGSNEHWSFQLAKADIELFQIKQLLGAVTP